MSFASKRVAVIGTGATAVQAITEIAKTVGHLTVFQRTPNWCAPLHNRPDLDASTQARIKATYPEIFAICRESFGCFIHQADPRNALEVSPEEREAFYEKLYSEPGFGIWMGNFRDILIDRGGQRHHHRFMRGKIRARVHDPALAEKLIPTNHGFGTRRVPLESGYYEVYNQPNVRLVDLRETPIERITPSGISTSDAEHAIRHDHLRHRLRRHHRRVRSHRYPRARRAAAQGQVGRRAAHLSSGSRSTGFPNMLTLVGPHNAATFCNIPRCIEQNVEWVTALIATWARRATPAWSRPRRPREWTQHVHDTERACCFTRWTPG